MPRSIRPCPASVDAFAEDQRADAERVAEGEQPVAGDQRDDRVRALDPLVHLADGLEDLVGVEVEPVIWPCSSVASTLSSISVSLVELTCRRSMLNRSADSSRSVREVAVVHEDDAVRCVHVERLRLFFALGGALRRVAHVPEADVADAASACRGCGTPRAPAPWPSSCGRRGRRQWRCPSSPDRGAAAAAGCRRSAG